MHRLASPHLNANSFHHVSKTALRSAAHKSRHVLALSLVALLLVIAYPQPDQKTPANIAARPASHSALPKLSNAPEPIAPSPADPSPNTTASTASQTPATPKKSSTATTQTKPAPSHEDTLHYALPPPSNYIPPPPPEPSVQPNFTIHVIQTGPQSIAWTSSYRANGYYLIFQTQGGCGQSAVVIPCTTYLTAPGTTSGSYAFNYGSPGQTYGVTALVTVCVNENISNCGMASDNYVYLHF